MTNPQVPFYPPPAAATPELQPPTQRSAPIDEKLQKLVDKAFSAEGSENARNFRNLLHGTWLGDPLHASLTDVPLGSWTGAMVFDLLDELSHRRELSTAADASIAVGIAGALAAALAGLADWSQTDPPARRVGMFHGLLNIGATTLFVTSFVLRQNRRRGRGRLFAALGYCTVLFSARLGGNWYTPTVLVSIAPAARISLRILFR